MKTSIKVNNSIQESKSISGLILSMIKKSLGRYKHLDEVQIEVSQTEDVRVPIEVNISSYLENGEQILTTSASANYLSAFSQALARMERQMQKRA